VHHYNNDDFGVCLWKRREEKEEMMERRKKSFIENCRKWNGNNAHNKNKEKEIVSDKNSLTCNY
jgi:hypothetical protein